MGSFDEPIGKTVGRTGRPDPISDARILLRTLSRLHKAPLCPKGVFKFRTFEEADDWALKMMARPPERRS